MPVAMKSTYRRISLCEILKFLVSVLAAATHRMFLLSQAILGTDAIYLSSGVGFLRKLVLLYMACFGVFKELFPALTDNRPDHVNTGRRPNHFKLNVMILL